MKKTYKLTVIISIALFLFSININAQNPSEETYLEIEAKVIDSETNTPLVFTDIIIEDSNISTVTNGDGNFLLKIPNSLVDPTIIISHLGYE
ncbi:carboxypeptidase-like regulatory domain-containing protein, partial [Algibacter sp.]|uniref:carboxypeptidase-like regulatory domain-containing protein n=1 Tax=Algibacter sp. TaxID=1872428 RepID=UPI003C786464